MGTASVITVTSTLMMTAPVMQSEDGEIADSLNRSKIGGGSRDTAAAGLTNPDGNQKLRLITPSMISGMMDDSSSRMTDSISTRLNAGSTDGDCKENGAQTDQRMMGHQDDGRMDDGAIGNQQNDSGVNQT